ncbi:conserved hypothetical protein [Planktothrix agardhii]|nr:conserved hypothetical protein [Planktothrix agardhii]
MGVIALGRLKQQGDQGREGWQGLGVRLFHFTELLLKLSPQCSERNP